MARPGVLALAISLLAHPGVAHAFDNSSAGLSLHVVEIQPGQSASCTVPGLTAGTLRERSNNLSSPDGPFFYVYLLVCGASDSTRVGGFECGITYPGSYNPAGDPAGPITIFSWTRCSTLDFPSADWPAPGSGNLMTWSSASCPGTRTVPNYKYTVIGIGGYFYLGAYAPGRITITRRPASNHVAVADCQGRTDFLDHSCHLGTAGFGMLGYNACGFCPLPVQSTTWGAIKSAYGQ